MNRRHFLASFGKLGLFTILPGAGRIWRAERKSHYCRFIADVELGMMPVTERTQVIPIFYVHPERLEKLVLEAFANDPWVNSLPSFTELKKIGAIK